LNFLWHSGQVMIGLSAMGASLRIKAHFRDTNPKRKRGASLTLRVGIAESCTLG
jgi:hypothetical protein